jgi:uncharacterized protein
MKTPNVEVTQQTSAAWLKQILQFNLALILVVWGLWITLITPAQALKIFQANWETVLITLPGSIVAGGSGMDGGAVAFPLLTKLLHVPHDAKIFAYIVLEPCLAVLTMMAITG